MLGMYRQTIEGGLLPYINAPRSYGWRYWAVRGQVRKYAVTTIEYGCGDQINRDGY